MRAQRASGSRSRRGIPATALGAGLLAGVMATATLAGCTSGGSGSTQPGASAPATSSSAAPTSAAPTTPTGAPVRVTTFEGDGKTYGVGMPIIAYFSKKITDASAFEKAVKVTVNGQPAEGAWYFEPSQRQESALEAHYRLKDYWPAHASIQVVHAGEGALGRARAGLRQRRHAQHGHRRRAGRAGERHPRGRHDDDHLRRPAGEDPQGLPRRGEDADLPRHRGGHGQVQPGGDEERPGGDAGLRPAGALVGARSRTAASSSTTPTGTATSARRTSPTAARTSARPTRSGTTASPRSATR